MRFCNSLLKCCFLLLISFLRSLKINNKMCVCIYIIAVLSEGLQTAFVFAGCFYSLCNPVIIVFHTFVFNWKNSLENV
jgi:DNA polymerase III psi subunit